MRSKISFFLLNHTTSVICCLAAFALSSCKPAVPTNDSQTQSALFVGKALPFTKQNYDILRQEKEITFCVGHIGYDANSDLAKKRESYVKQAMQQWLAALGKSPAWKSGVPNVRTESVAGECPGFYANNKDDKIFRAVFYKTVADQVNHLCKQNLRTQWNLCSTKTNNSAGDLVYRAIIISPLISKSVRTEDMLPATVLHEIGHVLGLADTYNRLGVKYAGKNMPAAIMNYHWWDFSIAKLEKDDIQSLWSAEHCAATGQCSCTGRNEIQSLSGDQFLFCSTATQSTEVVPPENEFNKETL